MRLVAANRVPTTSARGTLKRSGVQILWRPPQKPLVTRPFPFSGAGPDHHAIDGRSSQRWMAA